MFRSIVLLLLALIQFPAQAATQQLLLDQISREQNVPTELVRGVSTAASDDWAHYQTWLDWWKREPERLGQLEFRNEPLIAGSRVNVEVTFRLGTDIEPGGQLLIATHWANGNPLQAIDPDADNYVEVVSVDGAPLDAETTTLFPTATVLKGVFAGPLSGRQVTAFEVVGNGLGAGQIVQFQLNNLVLPGASGDFYLPVYFSVAPDRPFFAAPMTRLTIRPGQLQNIEVVAPSRLGRNEPATIAVKMADQFGNPATATPELDVIVDGVFQSRLQPTGPISRVDGITFSEPGLHTIEVRTGGGGTRGVSNPIVVQSGSRTIGWADLNRQMLMPGTTDTRETLLDVSVQSFNAADLEMNMDLMDGNRIARTVHNSLASGGSKLQIGTEIQSSNSGFRSSLHMALPLVPTDERGIDTSRLSLIQMVSGESAFEWFANRFFQAGYRLGVTGSSHSLIAPLGPYPRHALTAIVTDAGRSFEQALKQRATYATTGSRMVIHAIVNGAQPGRRIAATQNRTIEGWVQGSSELERIELIKNGLVIDTLNIAGRASNRLPEGQTDSTKTLKVSMSSDSAPFRQQRDLPRNGREWIGFLKTNSGNIEGFSAPGFRNPARQAIAQNGSTRVDFITWTHGTESSFMVTLAGQDDSAVLELNLRDGHEDVELLPDLRGPSPIPASRHMVPLYDLEAGPITRVVKVNGYQDEIRFELVDPQAPNYAAFRFVDVEPDATEDYYYIRVTQLDDHRAWTSPVFVGGFDAP